MKIVNSTVANRCKAAVCAPATNTKMSCAMQSRGNAPSSKSFSASLNCRKIRNRKGNIEPMCLVRIKTFSYQEALLKSNVIGMS